jgi:hypothetical protein
MSDTLYDNLDIVWKQYIMNVNDNLVENMVSQMYNDESKIKQLEVEIERLKAKCDKQAMILRRLNPENHPDTYFISGEMGDKDECGLPKKICVVPAFGLDWFMVYERTDKVFGPEW